MKEQKNFNQFLIDLGLVGVSKNNQRNNSEEEEVTNDEYTEDFNSAQEYLYSENSSDNDDPQKMKLTYLYQHLVGQEYQNLIIIKLLFNL